MCEGWGVSADLLDDASAQEQQERDRAVNKARQALATPRPVIWHTYCAWCHEPSPDGREYCSYGLDSCAMDARREQEIRSRQGAR